MPLGGVEEEELEMDEESGRQMEMHTLNQVSQGSILTSRGRENAVSCVYVCIGCKFCRAVVYAFFLKNGLCGYATRNLLDE